MPKIPPVPRSKPREDAPRPTAPPPREERARSVEADREAFAPILGEDVADTLTGTCEMLEAFGDAWKLEPAKARRIGDRWARIMNRWAERIASPIVLKAFVFATVGFACVELLAFFASRTLKTIAAKREAKKKKPTTFEGNVVPMKDEGDSAGAAE